MRIITKAMKVEEISETSPSFYRICGNSHDFGLCIRIKGEKKGESSPYFWSLHNYTQFDHKTSLRTHHSLITLQIVCFDVKYFSLGNVFSKKNLLKKNLGVWCV